MKSKVGKWQIISRNNFLLTAALVAVAVGFLFPPSAHILDVFVIFSVSLTATALMITLSARSALQVLGFPLLIMLATMLRMALSVASAKLILSQGDAGTVINFFGSVLVRNNCMLAILIFGILAAFIFGVIYRTVVGIGRTASNFIADIAPSKDIGIDNDLIAGVISDKRALNLRRKVVLESGFFAKMNAAAKLVLCDVVIALAIFIFNVAAPKAVGVAGSATTLKTYTILAVGAGMVALISALLTALASRYLIRKSFLLARCTDTERIKVISNEVNPPRRTQCQELRHDNIVSSDESLGRPNAKKSVWGSPDGSWCDIGGLTDEKVIVEDIEWVDKPPSIESRFPNNDEQDDLYVWACEEIKDADNYETIAELIESKTSGIGGQDKTILMAAENVEELPVTIPVNIAMRLAQKNQRCLLIDLDLERDAIAKVFDVDSVAVGKGAEAKAIGTCIGNLWVWVPQTQKRAFGSASGGLWPASLPSSSDKVDKANLKKTISSLEDQYDSLIVYAPNVEMLGELANTADCFKKVMFFGPKSGAVGSAISYFYKFLSDYGCEVLKPVEVFAEIL